MMKDMKGLKGFFVVVIFLWIVVVTHYTGQVKNDPGGKMLKPFPSQSTSCSSSSSSSGGE